jgi:hypothetical protein
MAEVTGELGGQPILLENAATEATLYALLQATLATNSNKSQAAKIQQAYEEALKRTTKSQQQNIEQNNKNRKSIQDEIERRDQLNKRIEEEKEKRKKFMDGLRDVVGVLDTIGNVIGKTLSFALSTATPKVTDFTDALSGIPIIGPIIGAVGKAMQEQIDIFRELSSVGADFGSGINTMRTMAARAGLPLGVFAKAITENSSALAQLGGSTTAGARIFTAVNRSMQGPFQQGLARLGFSMEETAELTAGYLAIQTKLGRAQNMNQTEINVATQEHLLQLDLLARVHGMSRKEAQKLLDQQAQDKRFKLFYAQMGDNKDIQGFFAGLSNANKDFSDGMADLMMNNGVPSATNDMARSIALNSPRLVRLAQELNKGTISQKDANAIIRQEAERMGELAKATGKTQAGFANLGSPVFDAIAAMLGLKNIGAELTEEEKKQAKAKEDSTKNQLNFDKALLKLRETMYVALLPLINFVQENINDIMLAITNFIVDFVETMNSPRGFMGALEDAAVKVGKALKPILVAMFDEMLKNPKLTSAIILGLGALFVAPAVVTALAMLFTKLAFDKTIGRTPTPNVPGGPGTAGKVGRIVKGLSIAAVAGYTIDAGAGAFGVGKGNAPDLEQDEKNWNKASFGEKAQSAIPRSIENIADFIGLSNMATQAKKDRIAAETKYLEGKKPESSASPERVEDATSKTAMKMRAESLVQIKELTIALDKLDYNKLIIPETANKNIEINTVKMRLLRGEVNALTTSFKNLNDTGLGKITKGINSLSGEFKIFNEGFSLFKQRFEELDRTTEREALETISGRLETLNKNAVIIADNTGNTASNTGKLKGKPGIG